MCLPVLRNGGNRIGLVWNRKTGRWCHLTWYSSKDPSEQLGKRHERVKSGQDTNGWSSKPPAHQCSPVKSLLPPLLHQGRKDAIATSTPHHSGIYCTIQCTATESIRWNFGSTIGGECWPQEDTLSLVTCQAWLGKTVCQADLDGTPRPGRYNGWWRSSHSQERAVPAQSSIMPPPWGSSMWKGPRFYAKQSSLMYSMATLDRTEEAVILYSTSRRDGSRYDMGEFNVWLQKIFSLNFW